MKNRFFIVLSRPVQRGMGVVLVLCCMILVVIALSIVGLLGYETGSFLKHVSPWQFLGGLTWDPPSFVEKPTDLMHAFGIIPLVVGTLLITCLAMGVGIPLGLSLAIYLACFSKPLMRTSLKSIIEILAGVPSIVYGFFALYVISPLFHTLFDLLTITITSESALTAGVVLGVMVVPYMASLADDALRAVPSALTDQALALGSTLTEMILKVQIPAALPGLLGAVLMGFSRAIGETMLVVMAAGLTAHLTFNPLNSVTTITVQIVSLMTGDQEFESAKTLSAFALGFVLFFITLILNTLILRISHGHRKKYGTS